jgi:cytochrome c biogenesis protein CcdA
LGKARKFVLGMTKIFIGLGILLTIAGFVAVGFQQPYAVWYALLLPGVILSLVFGVNLYPIKKRYDDLEIRRMTSVDTMGS